MVQIFHNYVHVRVYLLINGACECIGLAIFDIVLLIYGNVVRHRSHRMFHVLYTYLTCTRPKFKYWKQHNILLLSFSLFTISQSNGVV